MSARHATAANRRRMRRWIRAMRKDGVKVRKVKGWGHRGHPGLFAPRGIMLHHDATAPGLSLGVIPILVGGRPDLPGPLCQLWLARNGTVYVIAAGYAYHGGKGSSPRKWLDNGMANVQTLGIEIDLTVGEKMSKRQRVALTRAVAAICAVEGWAKGRVVGHKEYQPGKVDPAFGMGWARKRIARRRRLLTSRRRKRLSFVRPYFARRWRKARKAGKR